MNIKFIILTFNRPNIMSQSIQTLINNTSIRPTDINILDDGSDISVQNSLYNFAKQYSTKEIPINLILNGRNYGIGYQFEKAYNVMRQSEDADIICFIEADYLWKKFWLEDVVAVFEASPWTVAIAGVHHPDMVQREKTHGEFCKLMVDQFGKDLESREHLYKPFDLETTRGKIRVEGVSNSCGCQIVHWKRLRILLDQLNKGNQYWYWMDRAFHKNGTGDRRYASDAHMSGTLSMFAEIWMKENGIDITKNFGFLNICDYSISSHICGGGINGMICPEGTTFVVSPTWKDEYLNKDPRIKNESTN
jgi:glycosyltransferase involved in cell wall biosynthesis